jgi:hypothetical protein
MEEPKVEYQERRFDKYGRQVVQGLRSQKALRRKLIGFLDIWDLHTFRNVAFTALTGTSCQS